VVDGMSNPTVLYYYTHERLYHHKPTDMFVNNLMFVIYLYTVWFFCVDN